MKPCINCWFILPTVVGGLAVMLAGDVIAQIFTTLHSFVADSDGAFPYGGLTLSGNILYGTTYLGGGTGYVGNVFSVSTDGTSFETLYSFTGPNSHNANSDGYEHTSSARDWIVRKDPGGTGTWSTDDDFRYLSTFDAQPFAIAANTLGNVFVGG